MKSNKHLSSQKKKKFEIKVLKIFLRLVDRYQSQNSRVLHTCERSGQCKEFLMTLINKALKTRRNTSNKFRAKGSR